MKVSRRFGSILKNVNRLYMQRFEKHAASLGLTLQQCRTLLRLAENEGVSQVKLAELTDLEPMALVRILDRMESEGLLERRNDPRDRRVRCLYLTRSGKPLLEDIRRLMDLTWADAFSGISREKSEMVADVLDKVRGNLAGLVTIPPIVSSAAGRRASARSGVRVAAKT